MRDDTRSELDRLFKKKFNILQERRKNPQVAHFESSLERLKKFEKVQEEVIRPVMRRFGSYLESVGHGYFIGSGCELLEGHLHPTSRISMHVLLNTSLEKLVRVMPSLSYRNDENNIVYLFKQTGVATPSCSAIGHFELEAVSEEAVETHLKQFLIETMLRE